MVPITLSRPVMPPGPVPSVDVYLTYRCNLRCSHCFLGEKLEEGTHFDRQLVRKLIESAPRWGTEEMTFLGGEPTLYPQLGELILLAQGRGMRARLVTNGQKSFKEFVETFEGPELPHVCFSVDGAGPEVHDAVRGRGAFDRLIRGIAAAREKGYLTSGIVSLSRANAEDCERILELCERLGFAYVNVHYVTNRGFATEESVLGIDEWLALVRRIERKSESLELDVRVERTFTPRAGFSGGCAVREGSNLMFFPDLRVFACAMFIGLPNAHSYTWTSAGLIPNRHGATEHSLCSAETPVHCPAIALINPSVSRQAAERGLAIRCIYDKSCLRGGLEKADAHSSHLPK